jgi:hypothetical protein
MTQGYRTVCPHCGKDLGSIKGEVELPAVWKKLLGASLEGASPAPVDVPVDSSVVYMDDSRSVDSVFLDDGCTALFSLVSDGDNYCVYISINDEGVPVYESEPLYFEDLEAGVLKFESHEVEYEITVKWV